LLDYASFAILRRMTEGGRRRRRKTRPTFQGRPNELGPLLADLRTAKGLSLREVEEATGNAVSNAYLSQLENGKIKKPSPNVLHRLAEVYVVPYEALMEKAGYLLPSQDGGGRVMSRDLHRLLEPPSFA
jgi:transcriptional regulator with XRE-family HTH domain